MTRGRRAMKAAVLPTTARASKTPKENVQRSIQSVERGFGLIRCLELAPGPLSLKELAACAGMPASKAHLYLVSFRRAGLVRQESTGQYALGPYALQLGLAALRKLDVISLARPVLHSLKDQASEAVYLAIWGNLGPCIVAKVDGPRQIPMTLQIGYVLPLLTTATGRVFLSHLPPAATRDIVTREEREQAARKAIFSEKVVENIIRGTNARGLAKTDSLLNSGFTALSSPVFNHDNTICAAMTLLGPSGLADVAYTGRNARLLRQATRSLSRQLGWQENR